MELYTDTFDEFSFAEKKDELEELLNIPHITPKHHQFDKVGSGIFKSFGKLRPEKSSTDGYFILLLGYARSPFQDFESYLRFVVGLDKDDIQLSLKQCISHFITYQTIPGIYTNKDIARLFTAWKILKVLCKMNMMTFA